jgi:hypothetical protein
MMKKYFFFKLFISLFVLNAWTSAAQTTLWQTGFETGHSSPGVNVTTALSHGIQSAGGNFAAKCWRIVSTEANSNPGKRYDGSVITGLLTFNSSRYYRATVYARIGTTGNGAVADVGALKIVKSSTATNAAMKAASGADILLTGNVNSFNYIQFQVDFTVASNESKYIGFQLYQGFQAKNFMEIDDIKIEESLTPFITTLPVELISFTSECQNEDVEVKWSTASEYNADYFTVQHSEDGMNWSVIGKTEAAGFSNVVLDYSFVHQNAARTKNYYRLLQHDNDGVMKMYNTILANCNAVEKVFMSFPNPSEDAFTVVVNDELLSGSNTLNITDASGKLIYSTAVELENGSGSFALEGLDLPAGLYYLQLNNGSHTSGVIKHSFR